MWIYNKQKNEIYEAPEKETLEMTEIKYQGYLRSRRALQVKGDHKWGDGISREENVHFEIMDCSKWFWVVCSCGWEGSSEKLNGGGQIADTGDYSDAYCPVCSSTDYADEDLGYGVIAVPLSPVEETKPLIICLCGSVRFATEFHKWEFDLSFQGKIVLAPCAYNNDVQITNPEAKKMFDKLHMAKIDLCDEVFVLNVGGYIGESTRNEINYAKSIGKPIKYLEPIPSPVNSKQ